MDLIYRNRALSLRVSEKPPKDKKIKPLSAAMSNSAAVEEPPHKKKKPSPSPSSKGKARSRDVLLLDCRTHTWSRAPSMGVARASAAAGVVDGKIYVFGGCLSRDCSKWAEVFDPKTQTWDSVPPPPDRNMRCRCIHDSVVVKEEKLYAVDGMDRTFYYSPKEEKWGRGNTITPQGNERDWCVIDKVMYACDRKGNLCWCEPDRLEGEPEGKYWREVKGLGSLKESLATSRLVHVDSKTEALWEAQKSRFGREEKLVDLLPGARLSNSGGNIVVFWDKRDHDVDDIWCADIEIRCAEISVQRRGGEIWGNVEWDNAVMTVNPFSDRYKAEIKKIDLDDSTLISIPQMRLVVLQTSRNSPVAKHMRSRWR
ncbi:unnamed protein product [Thlaspi arvense]|uniref:FKB95-like N-terminal Kelch domain-containing protein n=1 Tax=Thlaspi arvense TaxID=13288 RepID=A0AAU9T1J3_THLAR|nr:unnamed protein product [Thlaspi arvense]